MTQKDELARLREMLELAKIELIHAGANLVLAGHSTDHLSTALERVTEAAALLDAIVHDKP
jgi:hypothetical protein